LAPKTVDKNARREAARRQAEALRNQAKAQERKQRMIIAIIAVVVVGLLAVAGYIIWDSSQRTLLSEFEGEVPAGSNEHGGIEVGAGGVGSPNEDASTVQVYLDFACPYCAQFEQVNGEDLQQMAADGEVTVAYHPVAYLGEYSLRSAAAMAAVADRSPEHMEDFAEHVFMNLDPNATDEQLQEAARAVGVPEDVAVTITDGEFTEWAETASEQARRDGARGTPSIALDGTMLEPEQDDVNWLNAGELPEYLRAQG